MFERFVSGFEWKCGFRDENERTKYGKGVSWEVLEGYYC